MVEVLSRIVEEPAFSPANDFFKRLAFKGRALEERIQVGDIGSMMLAVMIFDRFGAHGRGQRVRSKIKLGKLEFSHLGSPKIVLIYEYYPLDIIHTLI